MKKVLLTILLLLLAAVLIVGCARPYTRDDEPGGEPTQGTDDGFQPPVDIDDEDEQEEPGTGNIGNKIIKTGHMEIETIDFDDTTSAIVRKTNQAGGFVESSYVKGRSRKNAPYPSLREAWFRLRIPSEKLEQFMTDMGDLGNVVRNELSGEDISGKYYDTEARLLSLKTQETRLLALMEKADQLSDILELERELSEVRYEIEILTGTLKKWDNLVRYSTLEIDITEVEEIEEVQKRPVTLWEKMSTGFTASLKAAIRLLEFLLVLFVSALPFLALFGAIAAIVLLILRLIRKRA
ncbi:MAG TPA: DUF4349 domain-containing protein [Candidatus Atribacteria bacterium]|nr:DUF4349 domain-containing protein [Candidatus Atribacteria bacterium]